MAKSTIRIRAKATGDVATVKALVKHPMETGTRKDKKGEVIPAHHITELTATLNGKTVMTANWGPAISQNPYLSFKVAGAKKGDTIKLAWMDNTGKADSLEVPIK